MNQRPLVVLAASIAVASSAFAQSLPVPLNYNFNGIVNAGEAALPDSPNGYRSISDRGLDFTLGVPADPLLAPYQFITTPDTPDVVHLGNRNTVDGSSKVFDVAVDGDNIGIQPNWLPNADQTGPQTTVLGNPLPIGPTTTVSFLYQISNGGGAFDVTFTFLGGGTHTATLSGSDWFGGPLPGTGNVDQADPDNNLSVTEGTVVMGAFNGQIVTEITFGNRSNTNAGYAILACNFNYPVQPERVNQIPLHYNFNGIAHAGETGSPDAPNGFRSISDRALDFTAGIPSSPVFARYAVVGTPGVLDMVLLGNRNTVDGGNWVFDGSVDGDNIGIQPNWLPNVNLSGPQTTVLAAPIPIGLSSTAGVLFHVSNGGGSCSVTFTYQSGAVSVHTITAPDWFGGTYAGRENNDRADAGANLNLVDATIGLGGDAGESLVQVTFSNRSNTNADYGIYALNVEAAPQPLRTNKIPLHYNWNGIVHATEAGAPDAPNGYRSIADRGLDFTAGVPATPLLADFDLVALPNALDVVMLGNRNTVASGSVPFDPTADGDTLGVQPTWLPNVDLTGPQATTLAQPILLDSASTATLLFQMTSGGGAFDVTFTFPFGSITSTVRGQDWVGGSYLARAGVDSATAGLPLRIETASIDLTPLAGYVLSAITFENLSNPNGCCAILAANVTGCLACANAGGPSNLGGGTGATMSSSSSAGLGCPCLLYTSPSPRD